MKVNSRTLAIALTISLALNLFGAGFLTARAVFGGRGRHGGRHDHGLFLGPRGLLGAASSGEARRKAEGVMRQHEAALRESRRALFAARRAVHEALVAEPFDRTRLEGALSEMRARTGRSQAIMHRALVELAQGLPPGERRRLGQRSRRGRLAPPPRR